MELFKSDSVFILWVGVIKVDFVLIGGRINFYWLNWLKTSLVTFFLSLVKRASSILGLVLKKSSTT